MAKIPNSPEEIFDEFVRDLKETFTDGLVSVILYGSGASGAYVPKHSDINFMVCLTEESIGHLQKSFELVKKWHKRNVALPLFLTKSYIESSLDSFPIEFFNLQKTHKLIYGEDVLKDLQISRDLLRLRCEEQIKGKLLHLRESFLQTYGQRNLLQELIAMTISAFANVFTALLSLKNIEPPAQKEQILMRTAEAYSLDQGLFTQILDVGNKQIKLTAEDLIKLTETYIMEIRKLAMIIDQMK